MVCIRVYVARTICINFQSLLNYKIRNEESNLRFMVNSVFMRSSTTMIKEIVNYYYYYYYVVLVLVLCTIKIHN